MAETKLRRRLTWAIGLGALLIVAVLLVLAGSKRWSRWFESRREPLPGPAINALVSIDAGEIELGDFARFLQDFTGLTVLINPKIAKRTVTIPRRMQDVDVETVRAMLEENGYDVFTDTLPNGTKVLRIREEGW